MPRYPASSACRPGSGSASHYRCCPIPDHRATHRSRYSVRPESEGAEAEDHNNDRPVHAFGPATPIALRPQDPETGQESERDEVRKGYELRARSVRHVQPCRTEGARCRELARDRLDELRVARRCRPDLFNAAYYVYPDGAIAAEAYRVISAAMAEAGMASLGRLTMSRASAWFWSSRAAPG